MSNHRSSLAGLLMLLCVGLILVSLGCAETKISPDKVPSNILSSLHAKFPHAQIDSVTKEKEDGAVVYDIEFQQDGQKFEADIKEDGTIANWEKAVPATDLPMAVRNAVEQKYPKSTIKEQNAVMEVKGGTDSLEGYEVTLVTADKKEAELTVAPDGKILEEPGKEK